MSTGNLLYMKNLIHSKKYRELEQAEKKYIQYEVRKKKTCTHGKLKNLESRD